MLAAKLPRLETVEVVEEPIPKPGKGEVLIQMKASALCRSDLHRYHGTQIFDEDESACYITPGHEPCGVVAELGEGVTKVKWATGWRCIWDLAVVFVRTACAAT